MRGRALALSLALLSSGLSISAQPLTTVSIRVVSDDGPIAGAEVVAGAVAGRTGRDGLPLYGQQVGGLGLLQIPPMDLGQVEVIKGAASALYGAGAMGGVVNLITRRPGDEPAADLLVNQSTFGASDAVAFATAPLSAAWRVSVLAGGHRQSRRDRDDDGWAPTWRATNGWWCARVCSGTRARAAPRT